MYNRDQAHLQECPTEEELAGVPTKQWPRGVLPALDRHPEVIRKIEDELLPNPAALRAYFARECATYTLRRDTQVQRVADFLGVAPAAAPGARTNDTQFCGDASGTYHGFYLCAPVPPAPGTLCAMPASSV